MNPPTPFHELCDWADTTGLWVELTARHTRLDILRVVKPDSWIVVAAVGLRGRHPFAAAAELLVKATGGRT